MPRWERLGQGWDAIGRRNPLGAILVRGELPDWDVEEFLATGRRDVERFVADLSRIVPAAPRTRALDFGCGVGRITRALVDHFDEAVGVDVAPSMIARARAMHRGCRRCVFMVNRAPHLRQFAEESFGVVYSRLVLQHVRPALVRRYVPELVRVLTRGGALMFQLPEVLQVDPEEAFETAPVLGRTLKRRLPRSLVVLWRRLKYRIVAPPRDPTEMFGMPRDEVLALIRGAGGLPIELRTDHSHGREDAGFEYLGHEVAPHASSSSRGCRISSRSSERASIR